MKESGLFPPDVVVVIVTALPCVTGFGVADTDEIESGEPLEEVTWSERVPVPLLWAESVTVTTTEKVPVVVGVQPSDEVLEEVHPPGSPV